MFGGNLLKVRVRVGERFAVAVRASNASGEASPQNLGLCSRGYGYTRRGVAPESRVMQ